MPSQRRPPAIAGVSSGKTAVVAVTYPSIASTVPGRLLGQLMESIPLKIGGIKLSNLLFGLPAALLAVPGFLQLRLTGPAYVLTTRSMQLRGCLSNRLWREVSLDDVDRVVVRRLDGQQFFPAGEIDLVNKAGDVLLTLSGVLRPDVFRQSILEARDARRQVASSLKTIEARQPVASA
ncbi:MAG: hypothetical protein ACT4QC_04405 [Planctomycetaceae bacterium]